jgi:hypothetical protein
LFLDGVLSSNDASHHPGFCRILSSFDPFWHFNN